MPPERTTARRGRPPLLDPQRVIETALSILDVEGLDAVTFRRLSTELGVSHMTLYGYFDSKESLLEAMVAHTIEVPAIAQRGTAPWDERLFIAVREIHDALVERPGIAELLVTHNFTGEWVGQVRDQLLDVFYEAGYDRERATDGISVIFNYLLGTVMIETSRSRGGSASSFEQGLRYLIDGLRADLPGRAQTG